MATRCQVLVTSQPVGRTSKVLASLYHHWDGYPGNMLGLFQAARERVSMHAASTAKEVLAAQQEQHTKREAAGFKGDALTPNGWTPERHAASAHRREVGRACEPSRMGSWLCAQEPDGFEIEPIGTDHGDAEFIYRLSSGKVGEGDAHGHDYEWFVRVDAYRFGDEREPHHAKRTEYPVLDWARIDSPEVDKIIADHEARVAAYMARDAAPVLS